MSSKWSKLHGLICLYKPPNMSHMQMKNAFVTKILSELNANRVYEPSYRVCIKGHTLQEAKVVKEPKISDHPLVVGSLFEEEDVRLSCISEVSRNISGVQLCLINSGFDLIKPLRHAEMIYTYQVTGILGYSTLDMYSVGKVQEKSSYRHVNAMKIKGALNLMKKLTQRRAISHMGYRVESQEAYDIISETGLVRPAHSIEGTIYGVDLTHFKLPKFTIELSGINLTEAKLLNVIRDLGFAVKTNACVEKIRRLRIGPYTLDHSLSHGQWTIDEVANNTELCYPLISQALGKVPVVDELSKVPLLTHDSKT